MLELLFNIKSPPSQSHFIIEPSSSPPMRREKALARFLLLWLLLAAFQHHNITIPKVQATESADFKLRPAKSDSRTTKGYISTTGVEGKKIHKRPSGPNPVGNHRPPSRA
ncbi:CLAVATA3/ESR (CLE)-related protein 46 [Rhododendron vialii]|uniref:CLAVATA3/ESR (CLE)-related protein 46 n=1 Tax=Rhododendron vialii TaxID=182163 RepID=UPI00265EB8DA|nr:CLAVATA3/ESR (CLE)-related protein 46 [Rhododendron vialii]